MRWLAIALLLAAAGLSVASFLSVDQREARVPSDASMAAASAAVAADFADGDAVVVLPPWEERPWHALQDIGPGTERFPFPALIRADRPDPARLLASERLWVISAYGKPAAPASLLEADRKLLREQAFDDGVRVTLWEPAGLGSLARMSADFARLRVARRADNGQVTPCRPGAERHVCGLAPWYDLHFQTRDLFHEEVEWIYAHPGPGPRALLIEWPDVPRGEAVLLRFGHPQAAVRHDEGIGPEVIVRIDGAEVARVTLDPWEYVMHRLLLPVPAGETPATVALEIFSPDPRRREVMLEADMLSTVRPSIAAWATLDLREAGR
ncbi:MAG: hypothetical protein H6744_04425 [Deltaproteobacteria bacterium]|nr:hypothetical protein [Deltaproteobacteria bacterium]MCB9785920.1 hypothetical protein [Deltaproteobacteria bacterium]